MRKYRNIKGNPQPKRILKYSEEWIEYRKKRGADSVKVEHCDVDTDGFHDAIVRDWRSPALKKQQICTNNDYTDRGMRTPTLTESSGGMCEFSSTGKPNLYCPSLDYSGYITGIFYHSPITNTTTFRSSVFDTIEVGEWAHVVFTRNEMLGAMYVNGQLTAVSTIMGGVAATTNQIYVGAVKQSNWLPDNVFNGRIDQISIWDRYIEKSDVSELYAGGNGVNYASWSNSLKENSHTVYEISDKISFENEAVQGSMINHVTGDDDSANIKFNGTGDRDATTSSGKVSNHSFTPIYANELTYPISNLEGAKAYLNQADRNSQQIVIDKYLSGGTGAAWGLSAWISPYGIAYSSHSKTYLDNPNNTFDYENEKWQNTYGAIFSDYTKYSEGQANANFTVAFRGKYKHPETS